MNSGEASSSSTSQGSDYEVFLSFRGEDTRKSFTDHLYNRLCNAGIRTFRDNEGLLPGEEIGPELLEMIQQSKICIPIFSKAFASSKWCLIELTQMMKCKKDILPIFYDVSPGIVKDQLESFGEAFLQHDTDKKISKETVKEWKEALKEVGHLKGWEKDKIYDGHEAKLVDAIVIEVLIKLNKISVEISDELLGMSHHVEEMRRILDTDNEGVRIVGIHGMGGIGKTTIAKFLYNQLAQHYQPYCSFIEDIREEATKHKDLVHLQNRLRRDILKGKDFEVETVSAGKKRIEDMLRNKKVLIVLDDVDDRSQLEAVAGKVSWFGSGSRIIVTTRDKAVLKAHMVTGIYEPGGMSEAHSLELFSLHAFKKTNPPADFCDIALEIVRTGAGLPLFMVVIGSLLKAYLDNKPFWESTSKKLKSIPNQDILKKLKISYDTLDQQQKEIFLDIACNLIGGNVRYCVYMWDDCEFFGENGVPVLVYRSLVKIGEDNQILMHDLMRDLGRDIVRDENTNNPEKRSRLWRLEDAKATLMKCKGTENVQTLSLSGPWGSRVNVPGEAFMRLLNLRYLQMTRSSLREGPLPKLRWLSLKRTHIRTGSSYWCLEKLVVLQLLELEFLVDDELQNLIKMSTNLKVLHIEACKKFTRTPDFSSLPKLEIIYLAHCGDLVYISPSINDLNCLTSFSIIDCHRVSDLPKDLGLLDALKELILDRTSVTEIAVPKGSMKKLRKLSAKGCHSLTDISSIVHLSSLQYLNFHYCERLIEIPDKIGLLVELQHLSFDGCYSLVKLPSSIGSLVNLQYLSFHSCKALVNLPEPMDLLVNLQYLSFTGCESLEKLPNSVGSLVSLQHLSFDGCKSLVDLPDSMCLLMNLQHLSFEDCESLVTLPSTTWSFVKLQFLSFDGCYKLINLPNSIGALVNLQHLSLAFCGSLVNLPDSIGSLVNLQHLSLAFCSSLVKLPESICSLVNLQDLSLRGCASLVGKIAAHVLINLNKISVEIPDELVGMSHHVDEMRRILDIDSEGVRIVGIHGMGGIGKTTIAKFMYNQLARHYQPYCSFIEATKHKDLVLLQNRLIRDILKEVFDVGTVSEGKKRIEDKLRNKKVLIVLDDVDDQSQLEAVAGKVSWFGSGSRIIVTTRDKAVLKAHMVTGIYEPGGMSEAHSLELFSLHAFKKTNPPADFCDIALKIVRTGAAGLPLTIVRLGYFLKGHLGKKRFWESMLEELKALEIVWHKIKRSYDKLDDPQKEIFLDIACHFIGENKRYCVYMWNDCEFFGENELGVLVSLSLVKIGEDNKLLMHPYVSDLGKYIVRQEKEKPISRLWRCEDAEETLMECKGTENVQSLSLIEPFHAVPREAFTRLSNLRYLQMSHAYLRDGFMGLLPKLRWFSLRCTRITGSSYWCLEKLVVLQLLELEFLVDDELQNLIKMSTNLKVLHIEACQNLTRTPDFSSFPDLEIIYLSHCQNLVEIGPSVKYLNHLTSFSIINCPHVSDLPKEFGPESLTELILDGTGVTEIAVPKGSMKNLQKLSVGACGSLAHISPIFHLSSLQYLNFHYCKSLSEIPDSIWLLVELQHLSFDGCYSLVKLPSSIGSLVNLQYLSFHSCKALVNLPEPMDLLVNLQYLSFTGCESLEKLPNSVGSLVSLQHLSFDGCKSLVDLPDSMCLLMNLQHLSFEGCESLVRLPNTTWSFVKLQKLSFNGCYKLVNLPDSVGSLVKLQDLSFDGCKSLVKLPISIGSLLELQHLSLQFCESLVDLPDSICLLVNLQELLFRSCKSLVKLPSSIGLLVKLRLLDLEGCSLLTELPESIGSIVNLRRLVISYSGIKKLPSNIQMLHDLEILNDVFYSDMTEGELRAEDVRNEAASTSGGEAVGDVPQIRLWGEI